MGTMENGMGEKKMGIVVVRERKCGERLVNV